MMKTEKKIAEKIDAKNLILKKEPKFPGIKYPHSTEPPIFLPEKLFIRK